MLGRKLDATIARIWGSVDIGIEKALRAKALELHVPVGVVIESALYQDLGRPSLSFENEKYGELEM